MTEDDTFRVLARPDIHKMVVIYRNNRLNWEKKNDTTYPSTQNIVICKHYGWGWIEFLVAKKNAGYSW